MKLTLFKNLMNIAAIDMCLKTENETLCTICLNMLYAVFYSL